MVELFIRASCVHKVCPGCCRIHSGLLGSLGCSRRFVGFIWRHCGAHWGSSCYTGVAGFLGVRPVGRRVHSGSLGSLRCTMGSFGFAKFIGVRPWGRRVHPG